MEGKGGAAVSRNKIKGSSQKSKSVETVEEAKKKKYHRTYSTQQSRQASKQRDPGKWCVEVSESKRKG